MRWRSFVAVGDSFTEGMDDPYPDGTYRGWADLVAGQLAAAAARDGLAYANLAVRGRLFAHVVAEQVPAALAMRPDLVSFAAGGNDVLRRNFNPYALVERFDTVVGELRGIGADVIVFRFADVMARLPGQRIIAPRIAVLNREVEATAERHGAMLVDLFNDDEFGNPALWSADRLHLSTAGHRRVAGRVLATLGVECDPRWLAPTDRAAPQRWAAARMADARWAGQHLAPWVKRRLTGTSSGDAITPKRPLLSPFTE